MIRLLKGGSCLRKQVGKTGPVSTPYPEIRIDLALECYGYRQSDPDTSEQYSGCCISTELLHEMTVSSTSCYRGSGFRMLGISRHIRWIFLRWTPDLEAHRADNSGTGDGQGSNFPSPYEYRQLLF